MGSILDRDPWSWSMEDVLTFFSNYASQAVSALPGMEMPPLDDLGSVIVDQGITGSILMLMVDDAFLLSTFKLTKLGQRAALIFCINKLRNRSHGYNSRDEPATWADLSLESEPMQVDAVPRTPANQQESASSDDERLVAILKLPKDRLIQLLAAQISSGTQQPTIVPVIGNQARLEEAQPSFATAPDQSPTGDARAGETFVQGENGRKRRRLDLSATTQPKAATASEFKITDLSLYLPERKHSIDQIFFGETRFGRELGPVDITHPSFVVEDPVKECFQYINFFPQLGTTSYIAARSSLFLRNRVEVDLVRYHFPAKALFPYGHNLQADGLNGATQYDRKGRILFGGSRSALVIQRPAPGSNVGDASGLVALREDEDVLESNAHELGFTREQIAELSGDHSDLLLRWKPSNEAEFESDDTSRDRVTEVESEMNTEFDDDQAEEDDDEGDLSSADTARTIQSVIDDYIATWKKTKLPTLEAKSAGTTWRKMKGSKAVREALIQGARSRIQQLESRLRRFKDDLQRENWSSAASLEKQCEILEVSVHDIQMEFWKIEVWQRRHGPDHAATRRATHKRTASGPAQAQPPNEFQHMLQNMDPEDRLSVSPRLQSSPPPVEQEPDDTRMSDLEGEHFHTPQGSPTPRSEHSEFVVPDDEGDSGPAEPIEATPGAAVTSKGFLAPPRPTDDVGNGISAVTTPSSSRFRDDSNAMLPSSSAPIFSKPENPSPAVSLVDLTQVVSSPPGPRTPAPARHEPKRRKIKQNGLQGVPTTSEADGWNYEELAADSDRTRILIKLLRDMGPKKREELHISYQELGVNRFRTQILSAIDLVTHQGEEETPNREDAPKLKIMKRAAYLCLAWYLARPEAYCEYPRLPLDSSLLKGPLPDDDQVSVFIPLLRLQLGKRNTPLFSGVKQTSMDDPQIIPDDDMEDESAELDDEEMVGSSSKKRRRPVKRDLAAEISRSAAKARSQHHTQVLSQQQSSNPAILQGMTNDDPSQIAINPVRDMERDQPIFIQNRIAQAMKPYQLEGVRFMWRELTADPDEAQGCLLAHTMGLGKTMQSIALITCVDDASKSKLANIRHQLPKDLQLKDERKDRSLRFLVICPPSLIENWYNEVRKWAPQHSVHTVRSSSDRAILNLWSGKGGVMLIGYQIFRGFVDGKTTIKARTTATEAAQRNIEEAQRILLKDPELVIADEAHNVKNLMSATAMAVAKIQSKARIALSGTPMSNDVDEIYAIISWVAPGYLGDRAFFSSFYGLPIKEGLYAESDRAQKRTSTIKLKNLHNEIEPKVNRADISVLKGSLQPKVEFILTVELTEQQSSVYAQTITALLGSGEDLDTTANTLIFSWLTVLGQLTAHPSIFKRRLLTPRPPPKRKDKDAPVEPQAAGDPIANVIAQDIGDELSGAEPEHANVDSPEPTGEEDAYTLGFTKAIVELLTKDVSDDLDPCLSAKTRLLCQILELSKKCNDKVLVFSSFIPTLDYLSKIFRRDKIRFNRIDGGVANVKRTEKLAEFQSGKLDVMLLSTRASGQGLNIQAANRVVIFDFGFNPAWEEQAIGRAYRLGQKKPVFVYRFVAGGIFESNIYNTQLFKTTLSKRVIDKKNTQRNAKRNTKEYLYPPRPVHHNEKNIEDELKNNLDPNVMSKILQAQVERDFTDPSIDICAIGTMETLQKETPDEELDEEGKQAFEMNKIAWRMAKEGRSATAIQNVANTASLTQPGQQPPSSTAPNFAPAPVARMTSAPSATQAAPHQAATHPPQPVPGHNHAATSSLPPTDIRTQAAANARTSQAGPSWSMGGLPHLKK